LANNVDIFYFEKSANFNQKIRENLTTLKKWSLEEQQPKARIVI